MKALATVAVVGMAMTAAAQQTAKTVVTQKEAHVRVVVVSLEDRKLALLEDGEVKKVYSVAVGKPSE